MVEGFWAGRDDGGIIGGVLFDEPVDLGRSEV